MSPNSSPSTRQPDRATERREQVRLEQLRKRRRRQARIGAVVGAVAAVVVVVVVVLLLGSSSNHTNKPVSIPTHPFTPGPQATMSTSNGPWQIPANAAPFIAAAGLHVLGGEQTSFHYHAHLDVFVEGQQVTVPAQVGFEFVNGNATGLTVLHTHDTSGIIHIESATNDPFVLGQFLTEWGVRLGKGELGGLVDGGGKSLRAYVNGHLFSGDPATILLQKHDEIVLWYGPTSQSPSVPPSYQFPSGL